MRYATQDDVAAIMAVLIRLLDKSPAPQMKYAVPSVAERNIRLAIDEGRGVFVRGYFIMFDIGPDWYTDKNYLIEQIILKVHNDGNVRDAVKALDVLRKKFNCVLTAVGDTQIGYMTPIYKEEGYIVAGTQLVKEH